MNSCPTKGCFLVKEWSGSQGLSMMPWEATKILRIISDFPQVCSDNIHAEPIRFPIPPPELMPPRGHSGLAGIIDIWGGLRIVVTEPWRMRVHLGRGEHLFFLPDIWLAEPVPWHRIPGIVKAVELYIADWINSRNDPDLDDPLRLYEIRCMRSPLLKSSLDTSTIVWG